MCRIFGNIAKISSLLDRQTFETLNLFSKSGGPDSTEYYEDHFCQLGFNRLSILDTSSAGNQPIISPSGRFVLMLNGEIYNYVDLSKRYNLTSLRSGSDAEVVAHLLELLDFEELLCQLNGMFAIAVWDTHSKQLFLARDFAGIKPLFFGFNKSGFVFGSQINQILRHPWFSQWSWSETGLREYLQFGFMPAPNTVAEKVFQLYPGKFLFYNLNANDFQIKTYKSYFSSNEAKLNVTDDNIVDFIHSSLKDAVNRQLVADVPLGVFLSGGIDSSLITAIASKIRPDIQTLSVGFTDEGYDESVKAAEYARILGVKNDRIILSNIELLSILDEHNQSLTEPIADYSTLPTYLISKVSSSKFKVMLSGDGGDELFWGYPRFKTFANSAPFFKIPGSQVRRGVKRVLKTLNYDITGFLNEKNLGEANLNFHSYLPPQLFHELWSNSSLSNELMNDYLFEGTNKEESLLYLRRNEYYQHLQKILVKVDRMSMANGLEVRVPLLDKSVLEIAQTIRPKHLDTKADLKWILKKILSNYIPEAEIEKQKRGFTPPLKVWSRGFLKEKVYDTLNTSINLALPFDAANKLFDYGKDYLIGKHDNLEGMWTLYTLIKWKSNLS